MSPIPPVAGGTSLEPKAAGHFVPGFATASVGDVTSSQLQHAPTMRYDSKASSASLQVARANSDVFMTPSPKAMMATPSREFLMDRQPDPATTPAAREVVFTIKNFDGWTYVLQNWWQNTTGRYDEFWAEGNNGQVLVFEAGGELHPQPDADSFPLKICQAAPPPVLETPQSVRGLTDQFSALTTSSPGSVGNPPETVPGTVVNPPETVPGAVGNPPETVPGTVGNPPETMPETVPGTLQSVPGGNPPETVPGTAESLPETVPGTLESPTPTQEKSPVETPKTQHEQVVVGPNTHPPQTARQVGQQPQAAGSRESQGKTPSNPKAPSMYEDGTYWQILVCMLCIPVSSVVHVYWTDCCNPITSEDETVLQPSGEEEDPGHTWGHQTLGDTIGECPSWLDGKMIN